MKSLKTIKARLEPYTGAELFYTDYGFIAWQLGTGDNYELLWIEVSEKGKGYGTELVREMVRRIKPYHSVFVWRKKSNESAGYFYRHLGFQETEISNLYKEDAVLGVIDYETLCQNLSIN
jgi:ribosomal protein S18 acetylase RimI-like enzyme